MKRILIICVCELLLLLCACGNTQTEKEVTVPETTEAAVNTEPTAAATENPFESESEIDFSDFETGEETQPVESEAPAPTQAPTQPQPTKPAQKPTEPAVKPTEPVEKPTEPETTEPEETQAPTTATPSIGADGYNNQIVRP